MIRQFNVLAEILKMELGAIRESLQEQIRAIRDTSETAVESKDSPLPLPLPVVAELQIPEADKREQRTQHEKSHTLQIWLTVGTWLAFGAAAIYAAIAAHQATIMNNTLCEVRKQSRAAQDAVTAAQKANADASDRFIQDERPYIGETNKSTEGPVWHNNPNTPGTGQITWNWHMTNYGKSPATNVRFTEEIKIFGHPYVPSHGAKGPSIGSPAIPGHDSFSTVASDPMPESEYDRLLGIEDGIAIRIKIIYTGLDGKTPYETGLCMSRTNTGAIGYCKDSYIK